MLERLVDRLRGKRILILGFGREGISTFAFIRKYLPGQKVSIADINPDAVVSVAGESSVGSISTGNDYLSSINDHDLVIKSPGIPLKENDFSPKTIITSQTDLFLEFFGKTTIGITGTKGKSTTSSLIHHIFINAGKSSKLIGNIGTAPFDALMGRVDPETKYVFEISSHQLENSHHSPSTAVILNLFPEHLDRYDSPDQYYLTKWKITENQREGDILICNSENDEINRILMEKGTRATVHYYSTKKMENSEWYASEGKICKTEKGGTSLMAEIPDLSGIKGKHNLSNMLAALVACHFAGVRDEEALSAITGFRGLPHRLEYVGRFGGIDFYNDSIATIPEATLSALETLGRVDTLLLGGFDRGLQYDDLCTGIIVNGVNSVILTGPAGRRIHTRLAEMRYPGNIFFVNRLDESAGIIHKNTPSGGICLLSPAAASYDQFRDFEERGNKFTEMAKNIGK